MTTPPAPRRSPRPRRRRGRRRVRPAVLPVAVLGALLAAELGARWIGPEIPRVAGAEERVYVKADQLYDHGDRSVVFLGASETAGGLIPGVVDEQVPELAGSYNAALVGAPPATNADWFRRVVDPAAHPDVAVIGMLPMTASSIELDDDPSEKNVTAYESAFDIIDPGGLGSWGWRVRQHSALIRYRTELRQPVLAAEGFGRAVADLAGRGSPPPAPDEGLGIDAETETDPEVIARNTAPDGEILDYRRPSVPVERDDVGGAIYQLFSTGTPYYVQIEELVATLRDAGTVPVIALAPVDRRTLEASGVDFAPLDRLAVELEAWAADHDVPVLDRFTTSWDPALFHDRNHLALAGAERWSAEVGAWLGELCRDDQLGSACGS